MWERYFSSIISNDFAKYFGWLFFDLEMKNAFSSIQSNAYAYAINQPEQYGIPLELCIPPIGEIRLATRGIKKNSEILILEVLGFDILNPPSFELEYSHKSIKKYVYTSKKKKVRLSRQEKEDEYSLNENNGERSREDTHQQVIDLEPTQIAFRHSIDVKRIPKQEQKVNQGDEYISNSNRGGGIKQIVAGLDESIFGGKITPIEFKSMEIADSHMNYGLDQFIAMIK